MILEKIRETTEKGDVAVGIYTISGYPNLSTSLEALEILKKRDITIFETAFPLAQGHSPELSEAIKNAHKVACLNGISADDILKVYSNFRPNLYILHEGTARDSVKNLLEKMEGSVDAIFLGWSEGDLKTFHQISKSHGIDTVQLVSVHMNAEEIKHTVRYADGFVYLLVAPKTGGKIYSLDLIETVINKIKAQKDIPVCCGCGIRTADQVKTIGSLKGCDGVIIGTAILEALNRSVEELDEYLKTILDASKGIRTSLC